MPPSSASLKTKRTLSLSESIKQPLDSQAPPAQIADPKPLTNYINQSLQALLILAVALTPLLFSSRFNELFEFPKMIFIYVLAVLAAGLIGTKWVLQKKIVFVATPLHWLVLIFLAWLALTTITSLSPYVSLAGYYSRFNGGLASYLAYVILFYALLDQLVLSQVKETAGPATSKFLSQLLWSWVIAATIVSVWGILEHFGHDPSCLALQGNFSAQCWVEDVQARVFATFGQPNWLATYLLTALPIGIGLLLNSPTRRLKLVAACATILIYAAFWYTYSRSGWFGLAAGLVVLGLCVSWPTLWRHKIWLIGIVFACLIITFSSFNTASLRVETSLSGHGTDSSTGSIRLIVWQGAMQIIKQHPLLGSGPETFAYSFLAHRPAAMNNTTEWNFIYNEAHNQVLNTAATIGLPGLFIWLSLLILPARYLWKINPNLAYFKKRDHQPQATNLETSNPSRNPHPTSPALFLPFIAAGIVAVFVSQLFGFAVVMTNLPFFLGLAIICAPTSTVTRIPLTKLGRTALVLTTVVGLLSTSYVLLRYTSAEIIIKQANGQTHNPDKATALYQQAIALNPYEPNYHLQFASFLLSQSSAAQPLQLDLVQNQLERAQTLNPHDLLVAKSTAYYYLAMSKLSHDYTNAALQSAQYALKLSPTDAEACQNLADIYLAMGNKQSALHYYNQLVALRPQAADSYLHRAKYYQLDGLQQQYQANLRQALKIDPTNTQVLEGLAETESRD